MLREALVYPRFASINCADCAIPCKLATPIQGWLQAEVMLYPQPCGVLKVRDINTVDARHAGCGVVVEGKLYLWGGQSMHVFSWSPMVQTVHFIGTSVLAGVL